MLRGCRALKVSVQSALSPAVKNVCRRRRRLIRMVDHNEREESEDEQDQPNAATIGGAAKAPGRVECVTCAHTAGITHVPKQLSQQVPTQ